MNISLSQAEAIWLPAMCTKRIKMLVHKNPQDVRAQDLAAQRVHDEVGIHKKNPQDQLVVRDPRSLNDSVQTSYPNTSPQSLDVVTDAGYTEIPSGSQTVVAWYEEDDGRQGE